MSKVFTNKEIFGKVNEMGVPGMKWGQKKGGSEGGGPSHVITTRIGKTVHRRITTVGKKALVASLRAKDKVRAREQAAVKSRIPAGNLKGKDLRQWQKFKGFNKY